MLRAANCSPLLKKQWDTGGARGRAHARRPCAVYVSYTSRARLHAIEVFENVRFTTEDRVTERGKQKVRDREVRTVDRWRPARARACGGPQRARRGPAGVHTTHNSASLHEFKIQSLFQP